MDPILIYFSLFFIILWIILLAKEKKQEEIHFTFSILIACRNEQDNLPDLFHSLNRIDYPSDKYEIILVNDASSDDTQRLLENYCTHKNNCTCYHLMRKSREYLGKKAALKLAADHAQMEILLFTDGDCIVPINWLSDYNNFFTPETGLCAGYHLEKGNNSLGRFASILNAAIAFITAKSTFPFTASGGNMAVRKTAFDQVNGYEKIKNTLAGDDKLLLNLIRKAGWKISFNHLSPVLTKPLSGREIRSSQLRRRYGKFRSSPVYIKIVSLIIFLFYLYLPFALIFGKGLISLLIFYPACLIFWLLVLKKFKKKFIVTDLIYLIFYPYLMIYYSLTGMFLKWQWQDQNSI